MSTPFKVIVTGLAVVVAVGTAVAAQQPRIQNGAVTTQPAGSTFVQSFKTLVSSTVDVTWMGYAVPVADGERVMCCGNGGTSVVNGIVTDSSGCCGLCRLENSSGTTMSTRSQPATASGVIKLEGSDQMIVLFRVADRAVERIRVFSEDCQLDAGGRPVRWLDNVRPSDSIALLESLVGMQPQGDTKNRVTDGAITAIAMHGDPAADASLERLINRTQPDSVRKKVTFWLGNARGQRGYQTLQRVLRDDPSVEVRKGAIFGLTQSKVPQAVDTLIATARNDAEPRLRSEALFWLAQKAGEKASATIVDRIDQDPDTEVKKKAVFALSQLPKDEGVPLLIKVARTNANPEVRKQAMFWLGQSKDRRATDFFAEVLGK
jgi:HEAT repeats